MKFNEFLKLLPGLEINHINFGKGVIEKIQRDENHELYLYIKYPNRTDLSEVGFFDSFEHFIKLIDNPKKQEYINNCIITRNKKIKHKHFTQILKEKELEEKRTNTIKKHCKHKYKYNKNKTKVYKKLTEAEKLQRKLTRQQKRKQEYIDNYGDLFIHHKDQYDFTIRYINTFDENESCNGLFECCHMYGKQQDVLDVFYLDYQPRHSTYDLNENYCIIFLNITLNANNHWRNYLDDNGNILYEEHETNNLNYLLVDDYYRTKNRITFMRNSDISGHDYVYLGIFKLDTNYNYLNDSNAIEPRLKYNKIQDEYSYNINEYI